MIGYLQQDTRHLDFHDAVRSSDPLARSAGLALDLACRMVPSPMAMFVVRAGSRNRRLVVVKVDSGLGTDPGLFARQYLDSAEGAYPILDAVKSQIPVSLIGTDELNQSPTFAESDFVREFLPRYDLESVVVLHLRPEPDDPDAAIAMFRTSGEPNFTDREKSFLRHSGPVLAHSYHCALESDAGPQERTGKLAKLTKREYEIAQLAALGSRSDEIATSLNISPGTVKTHLRNIYAKLDVDSRIHLSMRFAGH